MNTKDQSAKMPVATSVGKAKLDLQYEKASASAVTLIRCSKDTTSYIDFGSGFVLYDDGNKTVIATSTEVFDEDETILVCFTDGGIKPASVFVSNVNSIYTSLVTDSNGSSMPVVFSGTVARGESIFTVSRALLEFKRPGIYTGSVIHPRCESVNTHSGQRVNKFNDLFALSCPVAGPCGELEIPASMHRLIGALVFNFECEMVGVIERSSQNKYDLKFARLSDSVNNELRILFDNNDWMEALEMQLKN